MWKNAPVKAYFTSLNIHMNKLIKAVLLMFFMYADHILCLCFHGNLMLHHFVTSHNPRLIDSSRVTLHISNRKHLPAVRAVQGDCQWSLINCGNSYRSPEPTIHCDLGRSNPYFEQPITNRRCQPIVGHVSYPNDSPNAIRPRLCSNLPDWAPDKNWPSL